MAQDEELIDSGALWPHGPASLMHLVRRASQRTAACWVGVVTTDVSPVQYAALIVLEELGSCDQQTLCSRVGIDKSTGTYVVDRMVQAELINAQTDPVHRRRKLISLTPVGRKVLRATVPQAKQAEAMVGERLSQSDIATLKRLLSALSGVRDIGVGGQ